MIRKRKRKKMPTKIFIDFDDVLFDTKRFKHDLYSACAVAAKTTKEEIESAYRETGGNGVFNPDKFAEFLADKYDIKVEEVDMRIERLLSEAEDYIYPEAKEFLAWLSQQNYLPYILTYGDAKFQEDKVTNCGFDQLVDNRVIYTDRDKGEEIAKILDENEAFFVFVDDKEKNCESVQARFPEAKTLTSINELRAWLSESREHRPRSGEFDNA
jgi:FMN phosphatase YigB (HAD superfamily)